MHAQSPQPLALLRGAATVLPRPVLAALAAAIVRGLKKSHPKLLRNLAGLEPAVVHVVAFDLPYRFAITLGREPIALTVLARDATGADAEVAASVATLVDLLEGRIDSDTLFFRRDLRISGNTAVVVGLRNVLDREELSLAGELAALCGPLARPAQRLARRLEQLADGAGARLLDTRAPGMTATNRSSSRPRTAGTSSTPLRSSSPASTSKPTLWRGSGN